MGTVGNLTHPWRFAPIPLALALSWAAGCSTSSFSGNGKSAAVTSDGSGAGQGGANANGSGGNGAGSGANTSSGGPGDPAGGLGAGSAGSAGTVAGAGASIPAGCGASGATQAAIMSTTVQNGVAGNFVEYRVTVTDCAGKQIPFTASKVSFDIAASVSNERDRAYKITDANNPSNTVSGVLQNIQGSDLFNHKGSDYYHYETDKPVNFAAQANAIIVRIDLGGISMFPYDHPNATDMNTFLAFGNAAPVEAKVTLVGKPDPLAAIFGK